MKIRLFFRGIKHCYQKIFRGYSNKDLWGLDFTISKWILPRLKAFKKHCRAGFPGCLNDEKEWQEILDKMILAFELHIEDDLLDKEKRERFEEGMNLFAKWYGGLWD